MHSVVRVVSLIIKLQYNCTKLTCLGKLWGLKTGYYKKFMHFTSIGATFAGFKVSVVGKASIENDFTLSILQLLGKAFSFSVKIILFLTLSLLACFLKYVIGKKNVIFWLFSLTFEQGSVDKNLAKFCAKYLVSNWLLISLYLRIIYTTEMYTDITSVPIPSALPSTFPILINASTAIRTGPCSKERLNKHWITYKGEKGASFHDLQEQIYNKSKELHLGLLTQQKAELSSRIWKKRSNWSKQFNNELFAKPNEEFAVFYETSRARTSMLIDL